MNEVFVSYRRSDSSDVTGRIFDQLKSRFEEGTVFKDVDSIPLGQDFRAVIHNAVGQSKVLLVIIGKEWLSTKKDNGERRIDDPDDYVHLEIVAALRRQIPIIPVLVENANLPDESELPTSLRDLVYRNAARVRSDPDFHPDLARLYNQLTQHLRIQSPGPNRRSRRMKIGAAIVSAVVILPILILVIHSLIGNPSSKPHIDVQYEKNLWTKNWLTITEPRAFMSSSGPPEEGGGSFTNREQFLDMLNSLDCSTDQELEKMRLELRGLVRAAEAHPKDKYYNMRYTEDTRAAEQQLKRGVRNRAIDHGINVDKQRLP